MEERAVVEHNHRYAKVVAGAGFELGQDAAHQAAIALETDHPLVRRGEFRPHRDRKAGANGPGPSGANNGRPRLDFEMTAGPHERAGAIGHQDRVPVNERADLGSEPSRMDRERA